MHNKTSSTNPPTHIVGIGASAGGLEAIETFFKNMPPKSNLAFVVIQHLSPDYKSLMVELLTKKTEMSVHRAEDGMLVEADTVYLIPPRKNLTIFHGKLLLNDKLNTHGINLPIDIFLRSLSEDKGEQAIAIILSGTGSDGTRGVRAIKEMGGMVMVQNEESAKFDGMPKAAAATGVADFILAPEAMPDQLLAYVAHPYITGEKHATLLLHEADSLSKLFSILREATKVDFTYYKPSTITRRIERRMSVNQISELEEYVSFLTNYPAEVSALYRDLLIGVTSFFRDPEPMEQLEQRWLPEIFSRVTNRGIRIWVAGCSTGEEAYTLAILARESMERLGVSRDIKIFATDIDRDALAVASAGVYPESILGDLPPRLVTKYFYHKDEKLQVVRHLREMVVFAQHNLLKDPPFTNIDLISCRNLLIYLQPILQKKVFTLFNFSLNAQGILFLGSSESTGELADYFEVLQQKNKIFRSLGKPISPGQNLELRNVEDRSEIAQRRYSRGQQQESFDSNRLIRQFLDLANQWYLPLSLVINEQLQVLYIFGNAEGYLTFPSEPADFDINKLAPKDLAIPLSTGVQNVLRTGKEINFTNVRLTIQSQEKILHIRIVPLPGGKGTEAQAAVFLEPITNSAPKKSENVTPVDLDLVARQRIEDLEQELQFARENLQATIEELETSNEELQATNEELLASNEELQSTNEELQSTNEELQSTNEELYTVNAEYQNKIIELTELNNDVDNLLTSSGVGILLLDENLEVRKFSEEIKNIYHIITNDIGRSIEHLSHKLRDMDLNAAMRSVQQTNQAFEQEVCSQTHQWYLLRILPYSIGPDVYSGVLLTLVDITESRSTSNALETSKKTSKIIKEHMPVGLFMCAVDQEQTIWVESCNAEAEHLLKLESSALNGKKFTDIFPQAKQFGIMEQLEEVIRHGVACTLNNLAYADERITLRFKLQGFLLPDKRLAICLEDISQQYQTSSDLADSEQRCTTLIDQMTQGVLHLDKDGSLIHINSTAKGLLGLQEDQSDQAESIFFPRSIIDETGQKTDNATMPWTQALQTGHPIEGRILGIQSTDRDETRWLLVNSSPIIHQGDQHASEVFVTLNDITELYHHKFCNKGSSPSSQSKG